MATRRAIVRYPWVQLVGAGTLGALLTACTAIEGLDGLEVGDVGASTDAGSGGGPDGRVPGDGADAGDGGTSPGRDSGSAGDSAASPGDSSVDSAIALDASAPDSAAPDSAPPPNAPCVPLGVEPCAGTHENCVPDPNLPDADPLDPPSICLPIQGAGLGEGQPCLGSAQCAQGLDCIGTQGGTYACQWMCYDPLTAIIVGPPFDAGVLSPQPGRGGCPPLETCTSTVNGYPTWLSVCSGM